MWTTHAWRLALDAETGIVIEGVYVRVFPERMPRKRAVRGFVDLSSPMLMPVLNQEMGRRAG